MKFGVREIVDVVFKATANNQKIGDRYFKKYQPVFMIDTATTSSLEQATTTVYAQGGKGYARLIAWEGEKTMTFTVTDALMSPMGLAVLTGAGLIKPNKENQAHVHTTINVTTDSEGKATISVDDLNEEYGLNADDYVICGSIDMYATELDGSGAGIDWFDNVNIISPAVDDNGYVHIDRKDSDTATFAIKNTDGNAAANTTVQLDFYVIMNNALTEVQIEPESFGGYFYIEAQTLFRREDTGKDMAAELIIPKAKVQSAFTFTMAASGDPSTFDFVMDAMPGYTRFDGTKKQMCVIQIVGTDDKAKDDTGAHTHDIAAEDDSPSFFVDFSIEGSKAGAASAVPAGLGEDKVKCQENQRKASVAIDGNEMTVTIAGGVSSLNTWASSNPQQGTGAWIALDMATGTDDITKVKYGPTEAQAEFLSQADVEEADLWGFDKGHFVLWIKANVVKTTPKVFVLAGEGYTKTFTIKVVDA